MTAVTSRATAVEGFEVTWTDGARPGPDARWVPAVVPGGVHESLLAAGLVGHPYQGTNELDLAWVEPATWWYRARFTSEPGVLRFAGLDTVADVELDGVLLGTARNQHRSHEFPVATAGEHELLLRFPPPLAGLLDGQEERVEVEVEALHDRQRRVRPDDPVTPRDEVELRLSRVRLRKAVFSWGWDFAPRVPSRGVSAPVEVVHTAPALAGVRVRAVGVDVVARTTAFEVSGSATGVLRVEAVAPDGRVTTLTSEVDGAFCLALPLVDVHLWWTHDLGDPDLYDVRVTLAREGEPDDVVQARRGLRTLELDRSPDPDEDGHLFRFVLNGQPLFARGANWVPQSMLVSSVDPKRTRDLVRLARDGAMNMLRVWGGGVYPSEAFYDACDELGLLVWQDFMFACFDYPDPRGELAAEVELEAVEQVRRLRDRASLALWCGENEAQAIHELTAGEAGPGDWGWSFWNEQLPRVVSEHDGTTPYWPGSPGATDPARPSTARATVTGTPGRCGTAVSASARAVRSGSPAAARRCTSPATSTTRAASSASSASTPRPSCRPCCAGPPRDARPRARLSSRTASRTPRRTRAGR